MLCTHGRIDTSAARTHEARERTDSRFTTAGIARVEHEAADASGRLRSPTATSVPATRYFSPTAKTSNATLPRALGCEMTPPWRRQNRPSWSDTCVPASTSSAMRRATSSSRSWRPQKAPRPRVAINKALQTRAGLAVRTDGALMTELPPAPLLNTFAPPESETTAPDRRQRAQRRTGHRRLRRGHGRCCTGRRRSSSRSS